MFTDVVKIKVTAGHGGNGLLSFFHTKSRTKGGPDGGDGGNGGNVIIVADHNTNTLAKYRTNKLWYANNGTNGGRNRRKGKKGADIELRVPPGTVVSEGKKLLADLEHDGDSVVVARGGKGGYGNAHFTSSVRQSPKFSEFGEEGEEKFLQLELKLVADVGIIGLPNAGKSTLLSVISNAKPEIASYPFTTLVPNLGIVDIDNKTFLAADIPGLVEGASLGKGLGDEFLRHVERTKILWHLIDVNSENLEGSYRTIQKELKNYKIDLTNRPQIIVLTKSENIPNIKLNKKITKIAKVSNKRPSEIFVISAIAKLRLVKLLRATANLLQNSAITIQPSAEDMPTIRLDESTVWNVEQKNGKFFVTGKELETFAKRTNFDQFQARQRLINILERKGVMRQIFKLGGEPGKIKISISGRALDY